MCKNIVKSELQFPLIKHSSKVTENDIKELKYLKDLIKKILVKDPDERISLKEIKVHPFTTFDLNELEKKKFFKFNQNIFRAEDCKKELDVDGSISTLSPQSSSLSKRIKNLFSSKYPAATTTTTTTTSSPPPASSLPSTPGNSSLKHIPSNLKYNNLSLKELEHVDDLLDSYLDDSSSLGSVEGDDEVVVDTSNILGDLDRDTNYDDSPQQLQGKVNEIITDVPEEEKKHKPQPLDLKQAATSFPSLPPPRGNSSTSLDVTSNNDNITSPATPINENITTIIGESSPGNYYNSTNDGIGDFPSRPSRRSFEKQNKLASLASMTYQPTIISLSSPVKTKSESWGGKMNNMSIHNSIGGINDNHKHLNMFEPPLIFRESKPLEGNKTASASNTENNFGSTSRRNSNSSQHFGYGLSRITSSSSSLNLNAYLTDDDDDDGDVLNSASMPELNHSSSISTRYSLKGMQQQHQLERKLQDNEQTEEQEDHEESEEGDSTIIANNYQIMRNYNDMSSYLDGLD